MLYPLRVLNPTTVAEAANELTRLGDQAKVYAGGAELLLLLRNRLIQTDYLLDIKGIPHLNRIVWDEGQLCIGATVTHHRLETDSSVRQHLPMFAYAESQIANIRVRNQGTLGGNLCFNDPHSDPGTVLLVYEAKVTVAGPSGERRMLLRDFLVGMYATAIKPDELLVELRVPPLPAGFGSAYLRVHRFQRPTLGIAVVARLQNGRIEGTRLAVGCVGPRPERLTELENKLEGTTLGDAQRVIQESRSYLKQLLQPVDDLLGSADYKSYTTCVLLGRALEQAVQNNHNKDKGGRTKDVGFESRLSSFELKSETSKPKLETLRTFDLSLTINGKPWSGQVPLEETLLEFIRNRLGLTGTKRSCESEVCGACTVLVDNQTVSSCNYLAFEAHGRTVLTIEGLADGEKVDPLQKAFIRNVGAQCGYCTPGQIMAAKALLLENPLPTREQIADWFSGNICRCGAYPAIVTSILEASRESQNH